MPAAPILPKFVLWSVSFPVAHVAGLQHQCWARARSHHLMMGVLIFLGHSRSGIILIWIKLRTQMSVRSHWPTSPILTAVFVDTPCLRSVKAFEAHRLGFYPREPSTDGSCFSFSNRPLPKQCASCGSHYGVLLFFC